MKSIKNTRYTRMIIFIQVIIANQHVQWSFEFLGLRQQIQSQGENGLGLNIIQYSIVKLRGPKQLSWLVSFGANPRVMGGARWSQSDCGAHAHFWHVRICGHDSLHMLTCPRSAYADLRPYM